MDFTMSTSGVDIVTAAARRRQRRLRAYLRHERMSVAMALAESTHHTSRGQKNARAGVWGHVQDYTAKNRKPPIPQPELFSAEEPGGSRPAPLSEVAGWQEKVERHFVEHLAEFAPMVQILDALVPQMEDQDDVTDAVRRMDLSIGEQVIEVPKFIVDVISLRSSVREPQIVEQVDGSADRLVSVAHCRADRWHSSFAGWWWAASSRFTPWTEFNSGCEQNVSPVPRRGGPRAGLQGFPPVQGSAATFPVPLEDAGVGFFRTFPQSKKSAASAASTSQRVHASVSSSTPAAQLEVAPVPDTIEWVQLSDGNTGKTYFWNRRTRVSSWLVPEGHEGRLGRYSG